MTPEQRAERLHELLYSCESRDEMCVRVVAMEEPCADLYALADIAEHAQPGDFERMGRRLRELGVEP